MLVEKLYIVLFCHQGIPFKSTFLNWTVHSFTKFDMVCWRLLVCFENMEIFMEKVFILFGDNHHELRVQKYSGCKGKNNCLLILKSFENCLSCFNISLSCISYKKRFRVKPFFKARVRVSLFSTLVFFIYFSKVTV